MHDRLAAVVSRQRLSLNNISQSLCFDCMEQEMVCGTGEKYRFFAQRPAELSRWLLHRESWEEEYITSWPKLWGKSTECPGCRAAR